MTCPLIFDIWLPICFKFWTITFRRTLCISSSTLKCKSEWFCGREAIFIIFYFPPAHYTRLLPNTIAMCYFPALCTGSWLNLAECCCFGHSQGYHDVLAGAAVISRLQQALSPSWWHTALLAGFRFPETNGWIFTAGYWPGNTLIFVPCGYLTGWHWLNSE